MRGTFLSVCLGQKNLIFWRAKKQCSANDTNYQDDVRYLEKEGALGEAVCQAQGLTKPKKGLSSPGGASFW